MTPKGDPRQVRLETLKVTRSNHAAEWGISLSLAAGYSNEAGYEKQNKKTRSQAVIVTTNSKIQPYFCTSNKNVKIIQKYSNMISFYLFICFSYCKRKDFGIF